MDVFLQLRSKKGKTLAKHVLLGGFGSGKYFPSDVDDAGVALVWPRGDQSILQVDMSGLKPETTNIETMTLYKYLYTLERNKKVTEHKFSYSNIKRLESDSEKDKFEVSVATPMKYVTKLIGAAEPKLSCT